MSLEINEPTTPCATRVVGREKNILIIGLKPAETFKTSGNAAIYNGETPQSAAEAIAARTFSESQGKWLSSDLATIGQIKIAIEEMLFDGASVVIHRGYNVWGYSMSNSAKQSYYGEAPMEGFSVTESIITAT